MKDFLIRVGALLTALMLAYSAGVSKGEVSERTKLLEQHQSETRRLKEARDATQKTLDETARNWASDQARSEELAARTVADLRDRGIRLSVQLADSKRSAVEGYNRGLADGRAELHPETAEALVRITSDADRQVKALQDTLREVTK